MEVLQKPAMGLIGLRFMHQDRPTLFKGRHFEAEISKLSRELTRAAAVRDVGGIVLEEAASDRGSARRFRF